MDKEQRAALRKVAEDSIGDMAPTIVQLLDYIETLEKDAGRWRRARQFLSIEDIESWNGPDWKGHQPNESENIRADETIDAAMQGETE